MVMVSKDNVQFKQSTHSRFKNYANGNTLKCPYCESVRHLVIETRHHNDTIRRRRQCKRCKERFYTKEVITDVHCEEGYLEP